MFVTNLTANPVNVDGNVVIAASAADVYVPDTVDLMNRVKRLAAASIVSYTGGSVDLGTAALAGMISAAPVVGAKTVTTTAASLFAGVSAMPHRSKMFVTVVGASTVYWGPAGVTTSTGVPMMSGDSIVFSFNPAVATLIYFVSAANSEVRVGELA